jgi:putative glutamine amidotransferase
MQALNVSRGGTLIQDIESQTKGSLKHEQGKPIRRNSHSLEVKESKILSSLITTDKTSVNSSHHQSIKSVGENLTVTSLAKDGVIESIEDTREDRFVFGVQWHPELSWKFDDLSKNIFKVFVNKCYEFSLNRK